MHIEGLGLTIIEGQQCVRIVWYPSTIKFTHSLNVQSAKTNFTRIVPGNSFDVSIISFGSYSGQLYRRCKVCFCNIHS